MFINATIKYIISIYKKIIFFKEVEVMVWSIFWILLAIVTLIIELFSVGLISIWFTVGAGCALICSLLGWHLMIQWVVFILVSIVGLLLFRNYWVKKMKNNIVATNIDANVGKEVLVVEDIDNSLDLGAVKMNGQFWSAKSIEGEKIKKDTKVVIRKIEGNMVYVEEIKF